MPHKSGSRTRTCSSVSSKDVVRKLFDLSDFHEILSFSNIKIEHFQSNCVWVAHQYLELRTRRNFLCFCIFSVGGYTMCVPPLSKSENFSLFYEAHESGKHSFQWKLACCLICPYSEDEEPGFAANEFVIWKLFTLSCFDDAERLLPEWRHISL